MSSSTFVLGFAVVAILTIVLFAVIIKGVHTAYKNGVRDGYQNTWLPHVQKQVREQNLEHGDEVRQEKDYERKTRY